MQSYQNVSNSQLAQVNYESGYVANAYAKLSKCQQFTTLLIKSSSLAALQTLMQSYQNVSNSQLFRPYYVNVKGCKRLCKVIKMLAIHNDKEAVRTAFNVANAFAKLSKCQQFTTILQLEPFYTRLQTLMQSYQNVSNSQLNGGDICDLKVANAYAKLSKCQQFTTNCKRKMFAGSLQTLMQSYQNVSNSQLFLFP